jgi:predicted nucleic acid-binding protein
LILVDSSVWIDYFKGTVNGQTEKLHSLLGQEPLAVGDLILTEVLQGFDNERNFRDARKMLTSLMVVELGSQKIAIQAAKNFRTAAQARRDRSQDHRYRDCNPMHRERV